MVSGNQTKIRVDNPSLSFGGIRALGDVSLEVGEREILAVIRPDGAGKTRLLNCVSGFYNPQSGEIFYLEDQKRVTKTRLDKTAKLGLARTFQNIKLYTG